MFIIESLRSDGRRWVSGAFLQQETANEAMGAISSQTATVHMLREVADLVFPLFIIERDGFEYQTPRETLSILRSVQPKGEADHVHLNLFFLPAEYMPEVPGRNEMGRLRHWHISDRELAEPLTLDPWKTLVAAAGDA